MWGCPAGGKVWSAAECGKRTILGDDSEDRDTIIEKLEPTGPGGFHDETRWMDPSTQSLMCRGVRSAGGGADSDKPEERLKCRNCVQAAAIARCTEAGARSICAEGGADEYTEAAVNDYTTAANSDRATATDGKYAEAVDEHLYAAGNERAAKWVADDCTGAVVCTCTNADAGHVYV
jgi:hypothetical protein